MLWRGSPYPELDHPELVPEEARSNALRGGGRQQHAEALMAMGRVGEAVAELEAWSAAEPLREEVVGVLMQALVAAGRQGDTLAAFARLRARLPTSSGSTRRPTRELERRAAPATRRSGVGHAYRGGGSGCGCR